jgi:hypothetical protein
MSIRLTVLLTGLAVATAAPAVAAPAAHVSRSRAKVFTARLRAVPPDVRDYTNASGRARLVAHGRRARITVTVKGLPARRATYKWAITVRRCTGARVGGFTYRRLKTNRRGRGTATGRTHRFKAHSKRKRYVVVYQRNSRKPLLCGRLVRQR